MTTYTKPMNLIQEAHDQLCTKVTTELTHHILPFWLDKMDTTYGGFYGYMSHDLILDQHAMKGGLATARLLWTFSRAAILFESHLYRKAADHAYQFLISNLLDPINLGIYYSVDYQGKPLDTRKHIYVQAFGVYGLSEYYQLTQSEEVLRTCLELYNLITTKGYCTENNAYLEEFSQTWVQLDNELLSENGVIADYTYNTHLHILEAFTNLYKVWPNDSVKTHLKGLLNIFYTKIYNQTTHFYQVFFDKNWTNLINLKSYGHDIESSWLIDEALKALPIYEISPEWRNMVIQPAYSVMNEAIDPTGGLNYEEENAILNRKKIWWVQAEAFIGFYNAYAYSGDQRFLNVSLSIWDFIEVNFIDSRIGGEWHSERTEGNELTTKPIIEPWKLNYHNGRCCLEYISRYNLL